LHAKHSDAVSVTVPHLNFYSEGSVPYVNYANGDRFLGGDYLNLVFCLDCGQIQNFVKIVDTEIDADRDSDDNIWSDE
jgi:hypothetical protein